MADEFSERFCAALARRLPELAAQLRPGAGGESLEFWLPAPSGHGELGVSTAGGEVTVGFGRWHAHYEEQDYWPDGEPAGEPFEAVGAFLADFVRDIVAIRFWTLRGTDVMSGPHHRWHSGPLGGADDRVDSYSMISWTGRGDLGPVPTDPAALREWIRQMG